MMNPRRDNEGRVTHWGDRKNTPTPFPMTNPQYAVALGTALMTCLAGAVVGVLIAETISAVLGSDSWLRLVGDLCGYICGAVLAAPFSYEVGAAAAKRIGGAATTNK